MASHKQTLGLVAKFALVAQWFTAFLICTTASFIISVAIAAVLQPTHSYVLSVASPDSILFALVAWIYMLVVTAAAFAFGCEVLALTTFRWFPARADDNAAGVLIFIAVSVGLFLGLWMFGGEFSQQVLAAIFEAARLMRER